MEKSERQMMVCSSPATSFETSPEPAANDDQVISRILIEASYLQSFPWPYVVPLNPPVISQAASGKRAWITERKPSITTSGSGETAPSTQPS